MNQTLTGAPPLLRAALKQDVRNIGPWIVLISALSATSVLAYAWVFPDLADRQELAATLGSNPALSLIFGVPRDLLTADGFNAWRAGALGTFFAALMTTFIVIRNSRADEDSGQAELLASGVMGRQTRLAVALIMAVQASIGLGIVSWLLTIACGGGLLNSLALSATYTASGIMFAGVAAVAAQIGSDARTANSIAVATIGIAYIVRGYIDASQTGEWATWLTPFGWLEEVRPASGNNAWPLLLAVAFAIVLARVALILHGRRDFGLGMIAPRPGPARAGAVASVWGLALRINRGPLISWLIAFAGLGTVFGFLATSVGDVLGNSPLVQSNATTEAGLIFAFIVTILQLAGIIASVFGVQIVMRIYAEEVAYRVEPVLAGSLSRAKYLASNAIIAFLAPAAALLIAGTVIGLIAAAAEPGLAAGDVVRQALATVPAVWTIVAVSLATVGARPQVRLAGWLAVVVTFALTLLGPLFKLWDWILGISPLWHVPNVTVAAPGWAGLAGVGLVAVLLTVVAFAGFRRRDVI
ncbi:ABC transporter permease [Paractinoplanes durhamensis]|uniref:ABC transporter permease n=1 Tax=Paractinoplanes durhamensis TaxID=113563 RepID=A0ABQ3Z4Q7_9ACTN|nr:multidrug ABC transporter permease [Actinoplanes durhamensis]GIE04776.1 ABC transporter permease [Actinoplanes durhamensis]